MTHLSDVARFWRRYHGDVPMPADDSPFPRFRILPLPRLPRRKKDRR